VAGKFLQSDLVVKLEINIWSSDWKECGQYQKGIKGKADLRNGRQAIVNWAGELMNDADIDWNFDINDNAIRIIDWNFDINDNAIRINLKKHLKMAPKECRFFYAG